MDDEMTGVRTLLLDADGCLFPSEEPAFVASTAVVNRVLEGLGIEQRYEPEALRRIAIGKNFRSVVAELAAAHGARLESEALEGWVAEEKRAVTAHLREALTPDTEIVDALTRLGERYALAVVSSSALSRLDACFEVTGLAELLAPERRFSAEDSLPRPTSKPDPAVYRFAVERLGVATDEALAVEDSVTGVRSAVAAGLRTVGNVRFVSGAERPERIADLRAAGAGAVVASWGELEAVLDAGGVPSR